MSQMTSGLAALPLLVFGTLFVLLRHRRVSRDGQETPWGLAFVESAVLCGAALTASTEVLSPFRMLGRGSLAVWWSLILIALLVLGWRTGAVRWAIDRLRSWRSVLSPGETALVAAMALMALVVGVVAWVSPPNTTDSHLYHMSRVVHWAQGASLAHYPTTYEHQLWFPPWAETAILTLRLLWGNDHPAGMVQWLCYVGSLILTAEIAGLLGAGRRGRLLAAAFCASVPMGLLQATSTQNDLVAGFWLLCVAYLVLLDAGRTLHFTDHAILGLAIGVAILTKTTVYLYAFPFVVWHIVRMWRSHGPSAAARSAGVVGLTAAALNAGYWGRNWITYGSPIGSVELVSGHTAVGSGAALPFAWVAHLLTHFATPSEPLNRWIEAAFRAVIARLALPTADFRLTWSWNHEDLAGSPVHLVAIAIVVLLMIVLRKRRRPPQMAAYAVAGVAGFGLVTTLLSWNPYVVRLHLPFLVVMAPMVGAAAGLWLRPGRLGLLSGVLILISLPWLLLNQTRPVVSLRPRTAIVSVFQADKVDILFANWLPERDSFIAAIDAVEATGCTQIGLRIDSHDLEYPYWWLLGAPQNGMRLEHLDPYPHLLRYVDAGFRPCAILCTVCGGRTRLHGLERAGEFGPISLFLGSGYTAEEDP